MNKAELKLKEFVEKWQSFYELSNVDIISYLLKVINNINNSKSFDTSKYHKGVIYIKRNAELLYATPKIKDYINLYKGG